MAILDQIELPDGITYDIQDNQPAVQSIDNLPQNIVLFDGAAALPMPTLKVGIEPVQDLHGYDAPWVGGAGKNKAKVTNKGKNGITPLNTYNGLVQISGNEFILTPTNSSIESYFGSISFSSSSTESSFNTFYSVRIKEDTQYTFSLSNNNFDKNIIQFFDDSYNVIAQSGAYYKQFNTNTGTVTAPTGATWMVCRIGMSSGTAGTAYKTTLQIEKGSSATTFAPYSNICPISGWSAVDVTVSPLNISQLYNGQVYGDGSWVSNNMRLTNVTSTQDNSYFLKAGTYTLDYDKLNSNAPNLLQCSALTKDGNYTIIDNFANEWNSVPFTFTLTQDGYFYFTIRKDADTNINPSDYRAKILGHTYSLTFTDGTNPLTVYGGYVDLVSGVLTVDRAYVDLGSLSYTYEDTETPKRFRAGLNPPPKLSSELVCSCFKGVVKSVAALNDGECCISGTAAYPWLRLRDDAITDATAFKTAVNGQQLVYELATPTTIQLSPTAVKSLEGTNNIFVNCGQITEGKYVVSKYNGMTAKISEFAEFAKVANSATSATTASKLGSSNVGSATQPIYLSAGTATACTYTLGKSVPSDAVFTDTKNTAGSTDTSSKIFLIGATSQAANPQTYSQDTAYVGTDGCLYSGGTKVLTAHQDISGKADKATTLAGYGITDAKIASGVITLGSNTITPLTSSSTLNAAKLSGTIPSSCYTDTNNAVTQTETQTSASTGADYEILFSGTADTTTRDEGVRKCMFLGYDPGIGQLKLKYTDDIYAWIDYAGIGAIGDQNSPSNYYGTFRANADNNATICVQRINSSDSSTTGVMMDGTGDITLDGTTWDGTNDSLKTAVSSLNSGKVSKSGDTMTGNLTIRTTNTEAQVIAECADSQIRAYLFSNADGDIGIWGKDYQDADISVIMKKSNGELRIYGDTYSVAHPDKFRSAISAVNKGGDTMTGALKVQNAGLSRICTGVTLGKTANNGVTSNQYPLIDIQDSAGVFVGGLRTTCWTSGDVGVDIVARNVTTSGDGTPFENRIRILAKKDGSKTYDVSDPANFRSAIGLTEGSWTNVNSNKQSYRKYHNVVYIRDHNSSTALTTSYTTLFTLPTGYRPSREIYFAVNGKSNGTVACIKITTGGVVSAMTLVGTASLWGFQISFLLG